MGYVQNRISDAALNCILNISYRRQGYHSMNNKLIPDKNISSIQLAKKKEKGIINFEH